MPRSFRPAIVAIGVASAGLAGCGSSTIDTSEVEDTIVAEFAKQRIPLTDTSCEEVEAEVGADVRCTALNPQHTKLFIEGKVTAIEDGRGRFEVKAVRGEADGDAVAAQARRVLEARVGQRAEAMTCPDTVDVPTTQPVRCTLTVPGGTRYGVSVTFDANGEMSAQVDDKPIS